MREPENKNSKTGVTLSFRRPDSGSQEIHLPDLSSASREPEKATEPNEAFEI
jgi:hypothetical protein